MPIATFQPCFAPFGLKIFLPRGKEIGVANPKQHKILILGGTADARHLAARLIADGHDVESSLAGVTSDPERPPGKLRIGGFGGPAGLRAYLQQNAFTALVDATHPFATQISRNAVEAVKGTSIPLHAYQREAWKPQDGEMWQSAATLETAAAAIPAAARVFLAVGRKHIAPFLARKNISGILRMVEPPAIEIPANWTLILARPPKTVAAEMETMRYHAITHLVCKNAGGAGWQKLDAARTCGIEVIMIERPPHPAPQTHSAIESIAAILNQS
jgi:precorrin-6A/cobalt-precorrin-6A reductase